jgi:hypothetical protein
MSAEEKAQAEMLANAMAFDPSKTSVEKKKEMLLAGSIKTQC